MSLTDTFDNKVAVPRSVSNDLLAVSPRPKQRRPRRTLRAKHGFCLLCGAHREDAGATPTMCAHCAQKERDGAKRRRAKCAKKGICPNCKKKHKRKTLMCADCMAHLNQKSAERKERLKAAGLCQFCRAPSPDYVHCRQCRLKKSDYERQYAQRQKDNALT